MIKLQGRHWDVTMMSGSACRHRGGNTSEIEYEETLIFANATHSVPTAADSSSMPMARDVGSKRDQHLRGQIHLHHGSRHVCRSA